MTATWAGGGTADLTIDANWIAPRNTPAPPGYLAAHDSFDERGFVAVCELLRDDESLDRDQ